MTTRSSITELPPYFDRYILKVPDVHLVTALDDFGTPLLHKHADKMKALGSHVYEPGKWTVNQIIQHLIDTERIFAYRTLRFARRDKTLLPGFDENSFAEAAPASNRSIDDLINEFDAVRHSTKQLFDSFSDEDLDAQGTVMGKSISVLSMGFTIAGHPIHHIEVLEERYYPLL